MLNIQNIRFVTKNYSSLQGLKAVPIGLYLALMGLWESGLGGPANDRSLPLLGALGALLAYALLDRYYARTYGRAQRLIENPLTDWLLSLLFLVSLLGATWLDRSLTLPISTFGLTGAAWLMAGYLRLFWSAQNRPGGVDAVVPILAGSLIVVSLLPLFGAQWWQTLGLGIKGHAVIIEVLAGLLIIGYGVWSHHVLAQSLPPIGEATDEHAV